MSEFLKRWSSRKSEARKHQVLQPREEVIPEVVATPIEGSGEGEIPDTAPDSPVVSTDKGSCEPLAIEGTESGEPPLKTTQQGKPKLPDKEALRALFRSHKPDGLDDYTQDFSQPELLPAALTAGLRNWLVETVTAPEAEPDSALPLPEQTITSQPPAVIPHCSSSSSASELVATLPAAERQPYTDDRDILVVEGGQNVPSGGGGVEHQGS